MEAIQMAGLTLDTIVSDVLDLPRSLIDDPIRLFIDAGIKVCDRVDGGGSSTEDRCSLALGLLTVAAIRLSGHRLAQENS